MTRSKAIFLLFLKQGYQQVVSLSVSQDWAFGRLGDPDGTFMILADDLPDRSRYGSNRRGVWDAIHYATAHFEKVDVFVTDDGPLSEKINTRIPNHVKTLTLNDTYNLLKTH